MINTSKLFWLLLCLVVNNPISFSQVNYTANDEVPANNDMFRYGMNPGYYASWGNLDTTLANISVGVPSQGIVGASTKSWRAKMGEEFVNQYGYDVRDFAFDHYDQLGMDNHTIFLNHPEPDHIDSTNYCAGTPSLLFDKLYEDIWDDGANGTPYNDDNHFAKYVYEVVDEYKDHVQYWEVWNEPDFSYSSAAYDPPSVSTSWWNVDPDPCDLEIKAPIYRYIRMMRIAYDVIKTVDSTAYVCTGGIGYHSFLDALLRNTDNPTDGSVSSDYPDKGGAYFDCLSFHLYPHDAGCYKAGWNNATGQFDYQRHSDAGADCIADYYQDFVTVLDDHDYDGVTYPKKVAIITETNIPRDGPNFEAVWGGQNYGNDVIQRNWLIKAMVIAQKEDLDQVHVYKLGEHQNLATANSEYGLMGLFENLNNVSPYNHVFTDEGKAYKTIAEELCDMEVDFTQTTNLALPTNINGAAFVDTNGDYKYVLWAKTDTDMSETASATYTFPASFNLTDLDVKQWDYAHNSTTTTAQASSVALTGSPIFLVPKDCDTNLTMTNTYSNGQTETFSASNDITATNLIQVGANIIYEAGSTICLDNGFEVEVNAVFEALIGGCQ